MAPATVPRVHAQTPPHVRDWSRLLCTAAGQGLGHAYYVSSTPRSSQWCRRRRRACRSPSSERCSCCAARPHRGRRRGAPVTEAGAGHRPDRRYEVPARGLRDGHTRAYQVSGRLARHPQPSRSGVGGSKLDPPYLGEGPRGRPDGPWGITARFLVMVTLGACWACWCSVWRCGRRLWRRAGPVDERRTCAGHWWPTRTGSVGVLPWPPWWHRGTACGAERQRLGERVGCGGRHRRHQLGAGPDD